MIKYKQFNVEIEAIKLALGTIHYSNGAIKEVFFTCIEKYLELYELFNDKKFLNNALLHMQAFFEMGFTYEEFPEIFDQVLSKAQTTRSEAFPKLFYSSKKVKLTKSQVRSMIHRWSASKYHTLTINELVDDIIEKVVKKQIGIYYYHSNKNPNRDNDDLYELVISENEAFFHDIARKKYFTFDE